jgi:c-di-GMP-binding flagellar brake protein YcgR
MPEFIDLKPGMRVMVSPPGDALAAAYESTIRQVTSGGVRISTPVRDSEPLEVHPGQRLMLFMTLHGRTYRFTSRVRLMDDLAADGVLLEPPSEVQQTERREYFRLVTRITPRKLALLDDEGAEVERVPAVILDLSGGGAQVQTEAAVPAGARVRIAFGLDDDPLDIDAVAEVRGLKAPGQHSKYYRVHLQFSEIARTDVERIVRYIHRQQVEMRRKGVM